MKLLILLFIAAVHAQGDPPPDGPPLIVPSDELVAYYNLTFIGEYWNVSYWCEYADRKTKKTKSKKKKSSSKKKSSKKSKKKSKKKGKGSSIYCPTEDELLYSRLYWGRELCIAQYWGWSYDYIYWNQTTFEDTLYWYFPPDLAYCLIYETDECYFTTKSLCEVYEGCCDQWPDVE